MKFQDRTFPRSETLIRWILEKSKMRTGMVQPQASAYPVWHWFAAVNTGWIISVLGMPGDHG
jgi:hypothetical protein